MTGSKRNRRYVKVFQLPPYWPELNATERIWHYTRKHVTHNRFFERPLGSLSRTLPQIRLRATPSARDRRPAPSLFLSSMSNYLCASI